MTFNLIVRRTHIYLAMFLLPWFFMYAVSALPFSHHDYFERLYDDGVPQWTVRFDRSYSLAVPETADLRQIGEQILRENGLSGSFGTFRPSPRQLNVYLFDFWSSTRLTYFIDEQRLLAEDRRFRWDQFFTGMHARGGFQQASVLNDTWAVLVDIVCLGILIWVVSGVYMWWHVPQTRVWGCMAIGGGVLSFLTFLLTL